MRVPTTAGSCEPAGQGPLLGWRGGHPVGVPPFVSGELASFRGDNDGRDDAGRSGCEHVVSVNCTPLIAAWRCFQMMLVIVDVLAATPVSLFQVGAFFPFLAMHVTMIVVVLIRVSTDTGLALALVAEDYGAAVALACAKRLVLVAQRQGGQSQFGALLLPPRTLLRTGAAAHHG